MKPEEYKARIDAELEKMDWRDLPAPARQLHHAVLCQVDFCRQVHLLFHPTFSVL